ncbi:MAG TPA: twin-arginine translocase subunit TatC [Candidatus Saccharimonadales bacterium]|nr:twin-arginine translocase subunit TatC [Candidatus Saccharimonadales bacterium]
MAKRPKRATTPRRPKVSLSSNDKLPLIEHIHELRRRLFYVAACVAVGSAVAYGFERKLIDILLRPSHGQHFIYTSPLGGMNFLFSVCLDLGLVVATPVIIYQLLAFLKPLMEHTTRRFLLAASATAGIVALCGVLFGYFIGLPSALHFLLHQFTTVQVRPLITIQSYMQFVALYLFGSALMFQLPLILLIINRIKPLKPSKLFKYERHLVVGSFIIAFIMNPTPNIVDQLFVVLPMIITYQLGVGLVWLVNRRPRPSPLQLLREQDAQRQAERAARPLALFTLPAPAATSTNDVSAVPASTPALAPEATLALTSRPRPYADSFGKNSKRSRYNSLRGQLVQ